ncbi:MAG: hypothetical protein ABSD64_13750 [Terriglobales bacterium]|jgi:hypothetical protein
MAVEAYPDQLEPADQDAVIWRFMKMEKFHDLMDTNELYFCRADLFENDKREGMPLEEYLPALQLNPLDVLDRQRLEHHIGSVAQDREGFYISCWHLFREETCQMWKKYGEDGVAICSRYQLLKSALGTMGDRAFLGLVRYGWEQLTGWDALRFITTWNVLRFITTKRIEYKSEQEVRAILWIVDPLASGNRHLGPDGRPHSLPLTPPPDRVLKGHRRRVDMQTLVTEVVVTPWASSATFDEVDQLLRNHRYAIPVQPSALTRYRELLPCTP